MAAMYLPASRRQWRHIVRSLLDKSFRKVWSLKREVSFFPVYHKRYQYHILPPDGLIVPKATLSTYCNSTVHRLHLACPMLTRWTKTLILILNSDPHPAIQSGPAYATGLRIYLNANSMPVPAPRNRFPSSFTIHVESQAQHGKGVPGNSFRSRIPLSRFHYFN